MPMHVGIIIRCYSAIFFSQNGTIDKLRKKKCLLLISKVVYEADERLQKLKYLIYYWFRISLVDVVVLFCQTIFNVTLPSSGKVRKLQAISLKKVVQNLHPPYHTTQIKLFSLLFAISLQSSLRARSSALQSPYSTSSNKVWLALRGCPYST